MSQSKLQEKINIGSLSKEIIVSLIFTESTASLMNLKTPYLEDLHPNESKVCVISPSERNYNLLEDHVSLTSSDNRSVVSEIGYFQINSCPSSLNEQLTTESSSWLLPYKSGSLPYVLTPKKIQTRPLVTIRSVAHDNRLDIRLNKIYISMRDNDWCTYPDEIFCRICHGGESIDDLLKPCRCRGTVALVHLACLERWLLESSRSYCELCQHHFRIIKQPRYGLCQSIFYFLRNPGHHWRELLLDTLAFVAYTPSAIASTYMLMVLCDSITKFTLAKNKGISSHLMALTAVIGIAVIDFTYTSWLMLVLQKHYDYWHEWHIKNSNLKVLLPNVKKKPIRKKIIKN